LHGIFEPDGRAELIELARNGLVEHRPTGLSRAAIAREIGRPACTVGRELKRNCNGDGAYRPVPAEGRYLAYRQRLRILDVNLELACFVVERLHEGWTPE